MKSMLIAFVAALAASATPAAACGFFDCARLALADDGYPPGEKPLPPGIRAEVILRDDSGLSLSGLYNDPSLALSLYAPRADHGYVVRRSY